MQTLVVMALKVESQQLFENAGLHPSYCGVGSVKAAHHLTKWLIEHKPQRVVNLGTAGSHRYPTGQLVECITFVQRHPHEFLKLSSEKLTVNATTNLPPVSCGSADFVEKASPLSDCDVFDMEAYALAYVCKKMNVPFHSIKYVTDTSNENLVSDWKLNLKPAAEALLTELRSLSFEANGL